MIQDDHRQLDGLELTNLEFADLGFATHAEQERSRRTGLDDICCFAYPVAQERDRDAQVKDQLVRPLVVDPSLHQHVVSGQHRKRNNGFSNALV